MNKVELEYRNKQAIHYSLLSKLSKDPSLVLQEKEEFSDGQLYGKVLEKLLFEPDDFYNDFYVVGMELPSEKIKEIIDNLFAEEKEIKDMDEHMDLIVEIANRIEYQPRWGSEAKYKKIKSEGEYYYNVLKKSVGKIVIPLDLEMAMREKVVKIKQHSFTSWIFNNTEDDVELLYQVPIYWNCKYSELFEPVFSKCLLDILFINHTKKTKRILDLKGTSYPANSFEYEILKWKYYLQSSFYTDSVLENDIKLNPILEKCVDYKLENFTFIVQPFSGNKPALCYEISDNDLQKGRVGWIDKHNVKRKGYIELITDYLWHKQENLWDYSREIYNNNGIIITDL